MRYTDKYSNIGKHKVTKKEPINKTVLFLSIGLIIAVAALVSKIFIGDGIFDYDDNVTLILALLSNVFVVFAFISFIPQLFNK